MYMLLFLFEGQVKLHLLVHHKHDAEYTVALLVASLSYLKMTLVVVNVSPLKYMTAWTGLTY